MVTILRFSAPMSLIILNNWGQAKRHVFLQKLGHKSPNISLFLELVKEKVIVERSISYSKGEEKKFKSFWRPLLSLIRV